MTWTPLYPLVERPWHNAKLKKQREDINGRIDTLTADRRQFDAQVEKLEAASLESLNKTVTSGKMKESRVELLQAELKLRHDLVTFFEAEEQARRTFRDKLIQSVETLKQDVAEKLVNIGYRPLAEVRGGRDQDGRVTMGMLERHPRVSQAKRELSDATPNDSERSNNTQRIRDVETALTELRNRMLRNL
jgi:hypothetical protein